MKNTIPSKCLVAIPDFNNPSLPHRIVDPAKNPTEAMVPAFDRSFHFGDSIYEVVRTYEGIPFTLDEHLRRLKQSAELGLYSEYIDENRLRDVIKKLIVTFYQKFGNMNIYVRVTVSRGFGDLNIDPNYASEPYFLVFAKELETVKNEVYETGVSFHLVDRRRNSPAALTPAMKSGNYLNNVLAIAEAKKEGASDALMLSLQGFVTEGTTNNFYMVKNGVIWTAPLEVGILAGITRDIVFEVCRKNSIVLEERLFTSADLDTADEMFFSSSTKETVPITSLSGRKIGNGKAGPVTVKLQNLMRETIRNYIANHKEESLYL